MRSFVDAFGRLLDATREEPQILAAGSTLLAELVGKDDWLPEAAARPASGRYAQHRLHLDPRVRFSVVSFVWDPGQATPVHDHTVWGLVGVLRGAELSQAYRRADSRLTPRGRVRRMTPGDVEVVSPAIGDLHQVSNALHDRISISIHVYGGDIGALRRHAFDDQGRARDFISGYTSVQAHDPRVAKGVDRP